MGLEKKVHRNKCWSTTVQHGIIKKKINAVVSRQIYIRDTQQALTKPKHYEMWEGKGNKWKGRRGVGGVGELPRLLEWLLPSRGEDSTEMREKEIRVKTSSHHKSWHKHITSAHFTVGKTHQITKFDNTHTHAHTVLIWSKFDESNYWVSHFNDIYIQWYRIHACSNAELRKFKRAYVQPP